MKRIIQARIKIRIAISDDVRNIETPVRSEKCLPKDCCGYPAAPVVYDYGTGIWIRCVPLKEDFKSDLWPTSAWHANRDTFNFYSKSPCDDMLPLAEVIRVLLNQQLDNNNKTNYNMRGYDPAIIKDPSELEWRPDGLVKFTSGSAQLLGDMQKGIQL